MLKGESGENFIKYIKKRHINLPTLVLSALGQIDKKIELLNLGADDYLTKPFDIQELIARIQALYRRFWHETNTECKKYGNIDFYNKQNKIIFEGKEVFLTRKEADILYYLFEKRGHVITAREFISNIWKTKPGFSSNIVAVTIRRLRKKLEKIGLENMIESVHGVGYRVIL